MTLVTMSDRTLPSAVRPPAHVVRWYVTNPDRESSDIRPYALGVKDPRPWASAMRSPQPPRTTLLLCHGMADRGGRGVKLQALSDNGFPNCGARKSHQMVDEIRRARFVASPRGRGLACYREYEAIVGGAAVRAIMSGRDLAVSRSYRSTRDYEWS